MLVPGEIDAQMIAHHEADNRQRRRSLLARTLIRTTMRELGLEKWSGCAVLVEHRDADHFGAPVAVAVIDVGDVFDDLRRLRWARRAGLRIRRRS